MLDMSYADKSRLRSVSDGALQPGRRMPNPDLRSGGRLFGRLSRAGYCWVVQGDHEMPAPDPWEARWCGLPVVFFRREDLRIPAEYPRGAKTVLVRPDHYIAAVGPDPETMASSVLSVTGVAADWIRTTRVAVR